VSVDVSAGVNASLQRVMEALARDGLLLLTDSALPSLVGLVAGQPVRGSWWGHRASVSIYAVLQAVAHHPDVVCVRLVSGKNTFVHRRLWPTLLAVAAAGAPWQTHRLSDSARVLLDLVERDGEVRTDAVAWIVDPRRGKSGEPARELERRLLVHSDEVHTESGAHAKVLRTWPEWASQVGVTASGESAEAACASLDVLVAQLNEAHGGDGRLPWHAAVRMRRRTS
jgi:hypothetical protein